MSAASLSALSSSSKNAEKDLTPPCSSLAFFLEVGAAWATTALDVEVVRSVRMAVDEVAVSGAGTLNLLFALATWSVQV